MRRIPGRVENDDTVRSYQIDTQAASPGRNQKEAGSWIGRIIEGITTRFAQVNGGASVQSEIVFVANPLLLTNENKATSV